ncbi:unnamed protein product [Camellia sinensis]
MLDYVGVHEAIHGFNWSQETRDLVASIFVVLQHVKPLNQIPLVGPLFTPPVNVNSVTRVAVRAATDPMFPPGIVDVYGILRYSQQKLVSKGCKLVGCGFEVPSLQVSNDDLAKVVDTSDEWISVRTGICNQRVLTGWEINDEINMKVKKYLRGEGANLEGLRDKKLKGQLAIREELYGKSAKAAAKAEKWFATGIISLFSFIRLNNIKTVHDNSLLVEETVRESNVHVEEDIRLEEYVCSDCSFNSDTQDVDMTKDSSFNCGSDSHTEDVEMDVSLPSVS